MASKVKIVEKLPNGTGIACVKRVITVGDSQREVVKYTLVRDNDLVAIKDINGDMTGIQFFDTYKVGPNGEVIVGVSKPGLEYYKKVLSKFDIREAQVQVKEVPGGPFNIGPYAKQYFEYSGPYKEIEEIVPSGIGFDYGLINADGVMVIYPSYDSMQFSGEDTCRVGSLWIAGEQKYGFNDVKTGKPITPVCFKIAHGFVSGRALVEYDGKAGCRMGYLDRNKVMTDPSDFSQYANGLAPRYFAGSHPFDSNGRAQVVLSPASLYSRTLRAVVDTDGEIVEYVHNKQLRKNKVTG